MEASMARKIYLRDDIGVGGFQKSYGGRKRSGSRPPHFCKSSGAIAHLILQQLQAINIIEIDPKSGWKITSMGSVILIKLPDVSRCYSAFLFGWEYFARLFSNRVWICYGLLTSCLCVGHSICLR